jgi:hypothetical protein
MLLNRFDKFASSQCIQFRYQLWENFQAPNSEQIGILSSIVLNLQTKFCIDKSRPEILLATADLSF